MDRYLVKSMVSSTLFLLLLPAIGLSADYQSLTTEELSELRKTMYDAYQEERDAFRTEWKNRLARTRNGDSFLFSENGSFQFFGARGPNSDLTRQD